MSSNPLEEMQSPAKHIDLIFTRPAFPVQNLIGHKDCYTIFLSKASDEHNSLHAIVTFLLVCENWILLVGYDELRTEEDQLLFLEKYFTNLSNHPIFPNAAHLMIAENKRLFEKSVEWAKFAWKIFQAKNQGARVHIYDANKIKPGTQKKKANIESDIPFLVQRLKSDAIRYVSDMVVSESSRRERVVEYFKTHLQQIQNHELRKQYGELTVDPRDDISRGIVRAAEISCRYMLEFNAAREEDHKIWMAEIATKARLYREQHGLPEPQKPPKGSIQEAQQQLKWLTSMLDPDDRADMMHM